MKTRIAVISLGLVIVALACAQQDRSSRANLIGTHDLVLVDQPEGELLAARSYNPDGGAFIVVGVPSRYVFVTSADTNELRILENYRTALAERGFVRAPNPLETLSIPVLDRPTMLAVDEGRNAEGARVTGSYVYAARPGGAEVSVVSVAKHRQLGGKPMAAPAPITAIGTWMDVDQTTSVFETRLPATTRFYAATWDGEFSAVYVAELPTNSPEIDRLDFQRKVLLAQTPITAMVVLPPVARRTLDGAPFCATKVCLALATRADAGKGGQALLVEPETGRSAVLSFKGPVRELVSASDATRIYAILDEQACGSPACGGVVAVDLVAANSDGGFPGSLDALGLPMQPLRAGDGLIAGLTVAASGVVQQTVESESFDGGVSRLEFIHQAYEELGAFSSSNGTITFFSGLSGSIIDFDGRRSTIASASVRLPGFLPDGGQGFTAVDGGLLGSNTAAIVDAGPLDLSITWRTAEVITADQTRWTVDLSDGYLDTQSLLVIYQGQIPGLVGLPTSASAGLHLLTNGAEVRAAVGDLVRFQRPDALTTFADCGTTRIATIGAGFIEVSDIPVGCEGRVQFSVRADGAKPLVAAADIEGYMGRWAPGETLTYNRPAVLITAGVTATRTALTIHIPTTVPRYEGAFTSFQILGHMAPLQITLDTVGAGSGVGCYTSLPGQVTFGNLVMDRVPSSLSGTAAIDFRWTIFAVVPSGNGLAEFNTSYTQIGALGRTQGANCWR